jgi:probable F420-dependent oxidoreductase
MEVGISLPSHGHLATPETIATLAQQGEAMGFAILTVSDHVVFPRRIESLYPYNASGQHYAAGDGDYLEQLSMLSFLAAVTSTAKLLTSVMVLPHRPPVFTAKMLATVDVLSNGRLIVGCGVGWMREEFEVLGTPPFPERGAVGDEYIRIFKELWTNDNPTFEGTFSSFANITFAPKPIQKPHPPIWTGGESPPALRRAGRLANAWYPIGSNPRYPVRTPEQFAAYAVKVQQHAQEAGRDPAELDFAYSANWFNDLEAQFLPDGTRQPLTGTPTQIIEDIQRYEAVGVHHMIVSLVDRSGNPGSTAQQSLDRMQRFADTIMPHI